MEKIFKSEFKSTRTNSSKLLLNITKDKNKKYLYQARDVGYEFNQAGYYHKTENGNSHLYYSPAGYQYARSKRCASVPAEEKIIG